MNNECVGSPRSVVSSTASTEPARGSRFHDVPARDGGASRSSKPTSYTPGEQAKARQKFSDVHQRSSVVKTLLTNVRRDTDNLPTDIITLNLEAAPNASEMPCIEATMVSVPIFHGQKLRRYAAHINQIDFGQAADTPPRAAVYRAGQSPVGIVNSPSHSSAGAALSPACEKALIEGIESGLGLYQFVSRKAHYLPDKSKETPIIGAIEKLFDESKSSRVRVVLGGRYEVIQFQKLDYASKDRSHCLLTVRDLHDPTRRMRTVPLTQAGLQFTGRVLKEPEIKTADAILQEHRRHVHNHFKTPHNRAEPTIYSYAGIGRNATLITYRRMAALIADGKITSEATLAVELRNAIHIERKACGKRFLHSTTQIDELFKSLLSTLPKNVAEEDGNNGPVAGEPDKTAAPEKTNSSKSARRFFCEDQEDSADGSKTPPIKPLHESAHEPAHEPAHEATTGPAAVRKAKSENVAPDDAATEERHRTIEIPASAEPEVLNVAHPNLGIPNLTSTSNEFHVCWNIASKLITASNVDNGQDFEKAFGKEPNHKLLRHFSKRQLAALFVRLGVPQNDEGFEQNELLIEHLSAAELALIPTLPKYRPPIATDALKKSNEEAAEVEKDPAFQQLAKIMQEGGDPILNPRAAPFGLSSFETWDNVGEGNCLFHALHSRGPLDYLPRDKLLAVRERTALVRARMPDEDQQVARNWNEMMISAGNGELNDFFSVYEIPKELSNVQFAELQSRFGITAGDVEIEQWLAIPLNPIKSVVIIDGLAGGESIVTFTRGEDQKITRKAVTLAMLIEAADPKLCPSLGGNGADLHGASKSTEDADDAVSNFDSDAESVTSHQAENVDADVENPVSAEDVDDGIDDVRAKIYNAIHDEIENIESRQHIVLYRQAGHYLRIVGLSP